MRHLPPLEPQGIRANVPPSHGPVQPGGLRMRNNRCARCGRVTFSPAVVIGTQPFGRVCARKAGLIEPKRRRRASEAERDTKTMELFKGVSA